jgi:hypothetical protein
MKTVTRYDTATGQIARCLNVAIANACQGGPTFEPILDELLRAKLAVARLMADLAERETAA